MAVLYACYSSGCGARMPKPSTCIILHHVDMTFMRLVGAYQATGHGRSQSRSMVAMKSKNNLYAKVVSELGMFVRRILYK
jgi:hypothetical protein